MQPGSLPITGPVALVLVGKHEQVCAERGAVHSYASMRNRDYLIINKLIIC